MPRLVVTKQVGCYVTIALYYQCIVDNMQVYPSPLPLCPTDSAPSPATGQSPRSHSRKRSLPSPRSIQRAEAFAGASAMEGGPVGGPVRLGGSCRASLGGAARVHMVSTSVSEYVRTNTRKYVSEYHEIVLVIE